MWNHPLEFKIFVILGIVLFISILLTQKINTKGRPQFLFLLFTVFVCFQLRTFSEVYPFTHFPSYARSEDRTAQYFKVRCMVDGGTALSLSHRLILPVLANGRLKHFARSVFQNPGLSDSLAASYAGAYEKKVRKNVGPEVRELYVEKWKWDFLHDPYDPERGYMIQRFAGRPLRKPS